MVENDFGLGGRSCIDTFDFVCKECVSAHSFLLQEFPKYVMHKNIRTGRFISVHHCDCGYNRKDGI